MKTFIRAQSAPWQSAIELYIGAEDRRSRVKEIVMERIEEAVEYPPCFTMDMAVAQTLMDDLWHCGIRPTEGAGSAGAMRATEKHLDDMRKIAFKKIGIAL